ncbi:MAG: DUF373 family protein [Candidatus Thermoplasmatota archaeon]|nr:DUF373 family protein [Candidatus Thermoplasmatota archaeon]
MRTVILNVDRDNDFGEKAGISGPVIGYTECYDAAMRLISTDPEDSDANALFGALKLYEDLRKKGEDVEVALVTGDSDVGSTSDIELGRQLDELLFPSGKFADLILVTDGAEDDYIIPLITSRIRIKYVNHVIVRHNQNIESVYYYIVKALKDKKLINKLIIPLGLILLTYGIVSLIVIVLTSVTLKQVSVQPGNGAITFVAVVLGVYFLEKGFELTKSIMKTLRAVHSYSQETRIAFLSYVVGISLVIVGIASSWEYASSGFSNGFNQFLVFLSIFAWWTYGAIFAREMGIGLDLIVNGKRGMNKILYGLLFSLAIAMIVYGMINYLRYVLGFIVLEQAIVDLALLILGIVVAVLSSLVNRYYNDIVNINNNEFVLSEPEED